MITAQIKHLMKKTLLTAFVLTALFSCKEIPETQEEAKQIVQQWISDSEIPGLAICISRDGQIVFSRGFGYADLEHRVPVYPDSTRFRIGSISKSLTAYGLGILMEKGMIDMDAPVQTYVPYFPEKEYPISTRQIAGHTAGIRHYREEEWLSATRYNTVREGLEIFMHDSLLFEPGTDYYYSSYGFNLVSAVIEGASGQDFLSFMHANAFGPLSMSSTVEDLTDSIILHRAEPYSMSKGNFINAAYVDNSYKWAGGGFLSSAADLVKFGNAMLSDTLLSPEIIQELTLSQKTTDGEETGYGIGFSTGTTESGIRHFGHGGGSVGGVSNLTIYPEYRMVMAIVTNDSEASFEDRHRLAGMFMNDLGE
jgi:CubicO group peptidase (beta-lactamase class C family)